MANYKLTTVASFSDNEEAAEPQYIQKYVEDIAEDIITKWNTADVTLLVDDKMFTAHRYRSIPTGKSVSQTDHHPWHKASEERPDTKKDVKLLGWFDTGSTAYDFDIIKYRVKDKLFCDRYGHPLITENLWWRTMKKPLKEG